MSRDLTPVLIGVGQSVSQWNGTQGVDGAPSVLSMMVDAAKAAVSDTGLAGLAQHIDAIAVVRVFPDSTPGAPAPWGRNTNYPWTLARDIGASPKTAVYSKVGGQSPQQLVHEMAARIASGELEMAMIAGAEALRAERGARRNGVELDWTDGDDRDFEDRGMDGRDLLSRSEVKHGLVTPAIFYALFENAIAAREGRGRSAHRHVMSELFTTFADVAATNPYAQFQTGRSVEFLETPSKDNFELADPFLRWHVAQDGVNQGAAVILTSEAKADELGVGRAKRVYLHGGGEAQDRFISERPRLDGSWAMGEALGRALETAGKAASEIDVFDLYSCFPCAVFSSTEALGIDWRTDPRPLTVTGGLPYFGGPGNNYSLHGVASVADRLRSAPGAFGLVLANGGWMSKEAAGVYSTLKPETIPEIAPMATPADPCVALDLSPETGRLETYTVVHGKEGPVAGIAVGRTEHDMRFLARAAPSAMARLREDASAVGAPVRVAGEDEVNTFEFA